MGEIEPVAAAGQRGPRLDELQDYHPPARSHDSPHLRQAARGVGEVAQAEGDGRRIELGVRHGERQGIAL